VVLRLCFLEDYVWLLQRHHEDATDRLLRKYLFISLLKSKYERKNV